MLRQTVLVGEIAEARDLRLERDLDGAGRAVALLADDQLGAVLGGLQVRFPLEPFFRAFTRLTVLDRKSVV